MDTLLILKRPIKVVKPNKKKLTKAKSKKAWPTKGKEERASRLSKASNETILESVSDTEHVSFVALYHDLCREYYGGSDSELPPCNIATILSAGDHARRAHAHCVMEIDY